MYDAIVLGGGTAGLRGALILANGGMKTLLIEPDVLGGTCLNKGCIPSKAMLHAAHLYEQAKNLGGFGITAKPTLNFSKLMKRVNGIVKEGQDHITKSIKNKNLTVLRKPGHFIGKNKLHVDGKTYEGKRIIIATGASNFIPPIPGLSDVHYYNNENILSLKTLPKSVVLIGGGYISMEYATFFAHLGCKVDVLEAGPRILGMLDSDVRGVLVDSYKKLGVNFHLNAKIKSVRETRGKKEVIVGRKSVKGDLLVVATGRRPNTSHLNLESAGVEVNDRGAIIVNDFLQTSNKTIYAVGDVNGKAMFAHAAKREIILAAKSILSKKNQKMDFSLMPWAVFTNPVVSGIGKSEGQLQKEKIAYETAVSWFSSAGRTRIIEETEGFVKILYDKKSKKILGAVIIGAKADDLIHEVAAVMNSKSPTLDTLQKTIHVHPTVSEVMAGI